MTTTAAQPPDLASVLAWARHGGTFPQAGASPPEPTTPPRPSTPQAKGERVPFDPTFEQSRLYFEARLSGQRIGSRREASVRCPFHDDRTASLSINLERGAWFCHACNEGGGLLAFERKFTGKDNADCWTAINMTIGREAPNVSKPKHGAIVATYDYFDAGGKLAYQAIRYEQPKDFRQRRPDGKGGWTWNVDGIPRVPFNLPALVRSNVVLVAEGEKDALNLQKAATNFPNKDDSLSYAATTNVGGAGKWQDNYSPYLAGKKVFVFADNDDAGRKHSQRVCASVSRHAQAVHLVELPGLAEHGDVSDYLQAHTPVELFKLMRAAPVWTPPVGAAPPTVSDAVGLKLKCGTEIADREQRWLVQDFLPDDSLIVVAGQVGLGKTTACMDLAASITTGRVPIIGGGREVGNILMLSNEDSEAQLRRIFTRLGGNLSRLYVEDEDSDLPWGLGDLPALEARIVELRPALVIIDSLTTHKPSKVDLNSHGDVAPMLVGVRKLAATHSCAIVVIHHTNKMQTGDPLAKISGSIGITATARHVILIAQHPNDENSRVAAIAKTNLCKPGAQSYQFQLDPFGWHGGTELRAADLLQGSTGESEPDADDFLREALADGKVDSAILFRQGENGYGLNRRSIQRAADRLNVGRTFAGFGAGRKVYWSLPSTMDDIIDDKKQESVIDGRQPMESALFDAGPTIDDKKQESVIDSVIDGQPTFDVEL